MPFVLRIEMLVLATVVLFTVFLAIRQRKLLVRFALIWLVIAVGMVFAALCPAFVIWLCGVVHIEQASNLIYLLGLLVLLFLSLGQTVLLSVIAVIMNYWVSRYWIFRKGRGDPS